MGPRKLRRVRLPRDRARAIAPGDCGHPRPHCRTCPPCLSWRSPKVASGGRPDVRISKSCAGSAERNGHLGADDRARSGDAVARHPWEDPGCEGTLALRAEDVKGKLQGRAVDDLFPAGAAHVPVFAAETERGCSCGLTIPAARRREPGGAVPAALPPRLVENVDEPPLNLLRVLGPHAPRTRRTALASVTAPTAERASAPIRSWSTRIAVVSPSSTSTSARRAR
jgi:hypothetical protein